MLVNSKYNLCNLPNKESSMFRIFIACFSYVILTFAIAMVWNMVIFRDTYLALAATSLRAEPVILLGLLSVATEAVAMSLLFHFYCRSTMSLKTSVTFALFVGVFSMTYASFTVPAKFVIGPIWQYVCLELVFGLLHYSLVGIVFFFIFNNHNEPNTECTNNL